MSSFVKCADDLTDDEFRVSMENLTLDEKLFNHTQHVRLGWIYLKREGSLERALEQVRNVIIRFAAYHGAPGRYHETITKFYLIIIDKFASNTETWQDFKALNQAILENAKPMIFTHYSEKLIASDKARSEWVEPDRLSL